MLTDYLDWEDIWARLRGMLWSAGALGLAGLCAGLWIHGVELESSRAFWRELNQPSALGEVARAVVGWMRGSIWTEAAAIVGWVAFVLRVYLIPELPKGRRLRGVAGSVAGLVAAFLVDKGAGEWGAADLWVRFGALLGCGAFLGIGLVLGERGGVLAKRTVRGGLSGGYIGLVCVFAAEIALMGHAAGASPLVRTVLPPAVCGAVIGLTLRGAELLLAGPVDEQWRRYWPLILTALAVLINAVGPVLLVQYWYVTGGL